MSSIELSNFQVCPDVRDLLPTPLPTDLLNLCASYLPADEAGNLWKSHGQFQEMIKHDYAFAFEGLKKRVLALPEQECPAIWERLYDILSREGSIWQSAPFKLNLINSIPLSGGRVAVSYSYMDRIEIHSIDSSAAPIKIAILPEMWLKSIAKLVGDRIVCGLDNGEVRILSTKQSGESGDSALEPAFLTSLYGSVDVLAVSTDGSIISGSNKGDLCIQSEDRSKQPFTATFRENYMESAVTKVAELSDGRFAVFTSYDLNSGPKLWCLDQVRKVVTECRLPLHEKTRDIGLVALPDSRIAYSTWDSTLHVVSLKNILPIKDSQDVANPIVLSGHSSYVNCMTLLKDGRIVSGSDDCTVRIWPLDYSSKPIVLKGHKDPVWSLTVLEDGRLASSSSKETIIWSIAADAAFQQAVSPNQESGLSSVVASIKNFFNMD